MTDLERDIFRRVRLLTAAVRENDLAKYKEAVEGCPNPNGVYTVVFLWQSGPDHHDPKESKLLVEQLWCLALEALRQSGLEKLSRPEPNSHSLPPAGTSESEDPP